jgi:hypothetical protein
MVINVTVSTWLYLNSVTKTTVSVESSMTYINIQYTYIVAKWVQINFIFNDNLRILCLFRNIKVQKTVKLSEISWHKGRPNRFRWRHLWCKLLYCYRFHSVDLHESGTNNALLGPWLNNMKFIWLPLLVLKIAQL